MGSFNVKQKLGFLIAFAILMLVIVGVALYRGDFARFAYWLLEAFPGLALVG